MKEFNKTSIKEGGLRDYLKGCFVLILTLKNIHTDKY